MKRRFEFELKLRQSITFLQTQIFQMYNLAINLQRKKEKKNIIIVIEGNNLRKKLKCYMWNLVDLSIASGSHRTLTKLFGKWAPFTIRIKRMSLKSLNDRSSMEVNSTEGRHMFDKETIHFSSESIGRKDHITIEVDKKNRSGIEVIKKIFNRYISLINCFCSEIWFRCLRSHQPN